MALLTWEMSIGRTRDPPDSNTIEIPIDNTKANEGPDATHVGGPGAISSS